MIAHEGLVGGLKLVENESAEPVDAGMSDIGRHRV
jgi:hypothetical protein